MKSFSIGVDLGGTNMRIAAVEESGRQIRLISGKADVGRGPGPVVTEMCDAIQELKGHLGGDYSLTGVGVGVPGTIDIETGVICQAVNLPGWDQYSVKQEIQRRLGTEVILENDANCAALGEKWMGAGRDVDHLCMLTLGTGVGGGFILNGAIWHGMMGMAGEIGHMTVTSNGPPCTCENRGCLERYASAKGILEMAGRAPALTTAMEANPNFSAETLYEYARQGNDAAREIFHSVGFALGVVLGGLINALNLPLYVIGGGVSNAWDLFEPALFRELRRRSVVFRASDREKNHRRLKKTMVTRALLGNDAGLLGAAHLPWLARM